MQDDGCVFGSSSIREWDFVGSRKEEESIQTRSLPQYQAGEKRVPVVVVGYQFSRKAT